MVVRRSGLSGTIGYEVWRGRPGTRRSIGAADALVQILVKLGATKTARSAVTEVIEGTGRVRDDSDVGSDDVRQEQGLRKLREAVAACVARGRWRGFFANM